MEVICEECTESGDKAEAFCHQCAVFICKECARQHKRMKSFSSHEVVSLEDLKQGRARGIATKEPPTKKCDVHEEPLIIFCSDCNLLICHLCTVKTHRSHDFEFCKEAAPDTRKKLLQRLCQTMANITGLAVDPAKCTVRGEGRETAEVGQTAEVSLTTKLTNNVITRRSVAVVSELKSLRDGSVECTVDRSGPGEYNIKYTPTVRGCHELTVSVDGQHVEGSPFSESVAISPTLLGKPVKVWTGISSPYGVTVNSDGEVIVCESDRDIIKLDKEGKKHVIVDYSTTTLSWLSDVATDKEDNVYCTDSKTNKILRCDKNGRNVRVYEVEGPGHLGVAVVGDELMLCQLDSKGTIMIYNRELEYTRRIVYEDMGQFTNLSSDSHGNLYVSDNDKSMIRVFSNDGVLLRSFGHDNNGVKRLDHPHGVCVSGQYVYVSNFISHVSVFTTAGHYVTSFGQLGRKEGKLYRPRGVCVDEQHNFILVCGYINNRVQYF